VRQQQPALDLHHLIKERTERREGLLLTALIFIFVDPPFELDRVRRGQILGDGNQGLVKG